MLTRVYIIIISPSSSEAVFERESLVEMSPLIEMTSVPSRMLYLWEGIVHSIRHCREIILPYLLTKPSALGGHTSEGKTSQYDREDTHK